MLLSWSFLQVTLQCNSLFQWIGCHVENRGVVTAWKCILDAIGEWHSWGNSHCRCLLLTRIELCSKPCKTVYILGYRGENLDADQAYSSSNSLTLVCTELLVAEFCMVFASREIVHPPDDANEQE